MIVDDEPFNLIALEGALSAFYHGKIVQAFNGLEALTLIRDNPNGFKALITDKHMPVMSGIQLSQEIRMDQ